MTNSKAFEEWLKHYSFEEWDRIVSADLEEAFNAGQKASEARLLPVMKMMAEILEFIANSTHYEEISQAVKESNLTALSAFKVRYAYNVEIANEALTAYEHLIGEI